MAGEVIYTSIPAVLESCSTLEARIAMLDTILSNMELQMAGVTSSGSKASKQSYKVDTGQTKIEVVYGSLAEMQNAYNSLLKTQQMLYARLNAKRQGRVRQVIDGRNFT